MSIDRYKLGCLQGDCSKLAISSVSQIDIFDRVVCLSPKGKAWMPRLMIGVS
jgi:hypothetical protein